MYPFSLIIHCSRCDTAETATHELDHELGFDKVPGNTGSDSPGKGVTETIMEEEETDSNDIQTGSQAGALKNKVTDTIMEEEESKTNNTQTDLKETETAKSTTQTSIPVTETQSTNSSRVQMSSENTSDTQSVSNTQTQSSESSFKVPEVRVL